MLWYTPHITLDSQGGRVDASLGPMVIVGGAFLGLRALIEGIEGGKEDEDVEDADMVVAGKVPHSDPTGHQPFLD